MTKSERSIEFAWLTLLGIPGNVWCGMNHVCMDGHLYHPEMPRWWLYGDFIWVAAFAAAALSALRSDVARRLFPFGLLLFPVFSRLLLASDGGALFILEIPVLLYLGVYSALTIHRVRRVTQQENLEAPHVSG